MRFKKFLFIIPIFLFLLGGCALKDLTESANSLIQEAEGVIREIDSQFEDGKLQEDVANLAKGVINDLIDKLSDKLQENAGYIFDRTDGTIDNIFAELSNLLGDFKKDILGGTIQDTIQSLSEEIRLQTTLISMQVEDIITIAAGNAVFLVDKTTNNVIIIASIILLAIGLLVFAIIFLRMRRKVKLPAIIGFVLAGIYVLFFLCIIIISPFRGWIIAGFNFGEKVQAKALEPSIRAISPQTFVLGKNERIILYGRNLNLIENLSVKLFQGAQLKKTFPASTIIVATRTQIIIGNLSSPTVGWTMPKFQDFNTRVLQTDTRLRNLSLSSISRISKTVNRSIYPRLVFRPLITTPQPPSAREIVPVNKAARGVIGPNLARHLSNKVKVFFKDQFELEPGAYGVHAFSEDQRIESPQFINIANPPPPAPKPDIFPLSVRWLGSAVKGKRITPELRLGFSHPEEINRTFRVEFRPTNPAGTALTANVTQTQVASASSSNVIRVSLPSYRPPSSGINNFRITVDSTNKIFESNEGNNISTTSLNVGRYVYDATITITIFDPKKSYDKGKDEYRVTVSSNLNAGQSWKIKIKKDGEPSNSWTINKSHTYRGTTPGDRIYIYTSGYEDDGDHWYDRNDSMGSASRTQEVTENITQNMDHREYPFTLNASGYTIKGRIHFERRIVQ